MAGRTCEICLAQGTEGDQEREAPLARVLIEDRVVALCEVHHAEVAKSGITTLAALGELYRESDGLRAGLPRRSPLDRRVFPPRPEGRRRHDGRRDDDID